MSEVIISSYDRGYWAGVRDSQSVVRGFGMYLGREVFNPYPNDSVEFTAWNAGYWEGFDHDNN